MSCTVDWPLTFEGFKTFLTPLANVAWPLTFLGSLYMFRSEIRTLIGKVKSIKGIGVEAEMIAEAQQQVSTSADNNLSFGFGTEFPPPHTVYTEFDNFLRRVLDNDIGGDSEKKLAWAIRTRSVSEVNRLHETNFRLIFGSQIKALRALNIVVKAPASDFERFFDEAKKDPTSGFLHDGRTFEEWGRFLLQVGYVREVEGTTPPMVEMTPFGQQFLTWMTEARVPELRVG